MKVRYIISEILKVEFEIIEALILVLWPYITVLLIVTIIYSLSVHSIILFALITIITSLSNIILWLFPFSDTIQSMHSTFKFISIASINNIVDLIVFTETQGLPIWIDFLTVFVGTALLYFYIKLQQ